MWKRELTNAEHQLVGLIMGEGCFSFAHPAHTPCAVPHFTLAMTETELPVLQQAQALLGGIGSIDRTEWYTKRNPKQRPVCRLAVCSDRDVLKVVELCEACELRSRKAMELPHVRKAIELRRADNPNAMNGPGRYREWTIKQVQACVDAIKRIRVTGLAQPVVTAGDPAPTFWKEKVG